MLGGEPKGEKELIRFATLVHWGYGTGWDGVRGLLAAAGLSGGKATAAHFGLVWGSEQVMLPALDVMLCRRTVSHPLHSSTGETRRSTYLNKILRTTNGLLHLC